MSKSICLKWFLAVLTTCTLGVHYASAQWNPLSQRPFRHTPFDPGTWNPFHPHPPSLSTAEI